MLFLSFCIHLALHTYSSRCRQQRLQPGVVSEAGASDLEKKYSTTVFPHSLRENTISWLLTCAVSPDPSPAGISCLDPPALSIANDMRRKTVDNSRAIFAGGRWRGFWFCVPALVVVGHAFLHLEGGGLLWWVTTPEKKTDWLSLKSSPLRTRTDHVQIPVARSIL